MTHRPDLPPNLPASPFTIAQARSVGIQPAQLRARSLQRPFYAVRSVGLNLSELEDMCRAYSARMHSDAVFSHLTAARRWGMPLPLSVDDAIHVTVPVPRRAPSGRGIVGHQQRLALHERLTLNGLALASPAATWAQLGELLSCNDLVAVGEHIITGNPFERRLPLSDLDELVAAMRVRSHGPGHRARVAALAEMRVGALSRPETFVRLLVTRCGIPQPVINGDVYDNGSFVAMPDMQWPEFRVALEYQGDHHREQKRFRADISRLERLVDAGWLVIQVTAKELYGDPSVIVERVARRLASRGWVGRIQLRHLTTFVP